VDRKAIAVTDEELMVRAQRDDVLAFYGDLTLSEIADRLEIPTGTAKGRMRLGLEKLRNDWLLIEGRSVGRVIR
jgi:DNA-directed RNA polymerase specialized sigma24 family protein